MLHLFVIHVTMMLQYIASNLLRPDKSIFIVEKHKSCTKTLDTYRNDNGKYLRKPLKNCILYGLIKVNCQVLGLILCVSE